MLVLEGLLPDFELSRNDAWWMILSLFLGSEVWIIVLKLL
jgi:hypothetical protein